jgi:hypothetical protein
MNTPPNWQTYPKGWSLFSRHLRVHRAGNRCECRGECGIHHLTGRCPRINGTPIVGRECEIKVAKVVLTVAHLWQTVCRCIERCMEASHCLALCQDCHLRYDAVQHLANAARNRRARKNNLELFDL